MTRRRSAQPAQKPRVAPGGLLQLLGPDLPEAACAGRAPLFDGDIPGETDDDRDYRLGRAAELCDGCPVRAGCASAAAAMPSRWISPS